MHVQDGMKKLLAVAGITPLLVVSASLLPVRTGHSTVRATADTKCVYAGVGDDTYSVCVPYPG